MKLVEALRSRQTMATAWSRHPQLASRSTAARRYLLETGVHRTNAAQIRRNALQIRGVLGCQHNANRRLGCLGDRRHQHCRPCKTSCNRRAAAADIALAKNAQISFALADTDHLAFSAAT